MMEEKPVEADKLSEEVIKPENSQDDQLDDNERKLTAMSVH